MVSDLIHHPTSDRELGDLLLSLAQVKIRGMGTRAREEEQPGATIELSKMSGIIDLRPADMTLSIRSGTPLIQVQSELRDVGLCLPTLESTGTIGGAYMVCATPGEWRDWVLGATYMLADGTIAKSGSHAVKSVAGYDIHRFMAGTRGSLVICLDLVLRVFPLSLAPTGGSAQIGTTTSTEIADPNVIKFMKRAKAIFDPNNKLNPGEWGFM